MVYQFKTGSMIGADPQVAGRMCEVLASGGPLTAKRLLDANRSPDAPLHNSFEWDDAVAAENYREHQAGHIIRSLVVMSENSEVSPVRAFISLHTTGREYIPLSVVVESPDLTAQMMDAARKELDAFQRKYESLEALAPVFSAAKAVFGE